MYQQGDVLIELIENVPENFHLKGDNHLAEGEATGHFHEAIGGKVEVLESKNTEDLVLVAPNGCSITHQEHAKIDIPSGVFRVRRVQEYDHFAEEARAVED